MTDEQDLLALKSKIDEAKTRMSEYKGRLTTHMEELKEKWECSSLKEAEQKKQQLMEELKETEKQLSSGIEELEQKFNL
jgi:NurA-like 5'-3' nuclease